MIRRRMPMYDPASDPDLFYWFDASDQSTLKGAGGAAITDGAQVYEWLNKKGSQKFVQIGSNTRPTWASSGPGGRPGLRFNGNHVLGLDTTAGLESLSGVTCICVWSADNPTTGDQWKRPINVDNFSENSPLIGFLTNWSRRIDWLSNRTPSMPWTYDARATGMMQNNVPVITTGYSDYANGRSGIYVDGVLRTNVTGITDTGVTSATPPRRFALGAHVTNTSISGSRLIGYIFAIFLWRRVLTPQELVGPHHYLRTKWWIEPSPSSAGGMGLLSEPPLPDYGEGEGESADDLVTLHHYLRIAKGIG